MNLLFLIILSLTVLSADCAGGPRRAQWMSGRWGIGYRIQTDAPTWDTYDVNAFIKQLRTIKGNPGWIIVNLSGPAHGGDVYLSHHPLLWSLNNTDATPSPTGRDLFKELLDAIHGEGLKVIVYMAGQGPALLKLQDDVDKGDPTGLQFAHDYNFTTKRSPALDRWRAYVTNTYGNPDANGWQNLKKAYVEQIVTYYANKFGTDIDGWWFDQGTFVDVPLLEAACHAANPNAVVAINKGTKVPLQVNNAPYEDFTFGHPNPIQKTKPSDISNLGMLTAIEGSADGFLSKLNYNGSGSRWDVLGHMFMPMGTTWNGIDGNTIKNEWSKEQAVNWMFRALESGGSWTWNLPRDYWYPAYNMSILREDFVDFLNTVVDELAPSSAPSLAPSSHPSLQISSSPSRTPSVSSSQGPSVAASSVPSKTPSLPPSHGPSGDPSGVPSKSPSKTPSLSPSNGPSTDPSSAPSISPSRKPSLSPSQGPSVSPSQSPSVDLSVSPSITPSTFPSQHPSIYRSDAPSPMPSAFPSQSPSESPSRRPTPSPTLKPTAIPTTIPPTSLPTMAPTRSPTTKAPTSAPTTRAPTSPPTTRAPTSPPTTRSPTSPPTTRAPTTPPPTRTPTSPPTTRTPTTSRPTRTPTTSRPTGVPTFPPPTRTPTAPPTTRSPTSPPTTRTPTLSPTKAPTRDPTTRSPTLSPTTKAPTRV